VKAHGLADRLRREFFDLDRREWARASGLSLVFFLTTAVFWIVKPIKRGLMLSIYDDDPIHLGSWVLEAAEIEQVAKVVNVVAALFVVALFTKLVRRFDRRRLIMIICTGLSLPFLGFAFVVETRSPWVAWPLFIVGDMYATLMVGTFWALTNDLMRNGEAERAYGIIGLGGVVGGFVGATTVNGLVESVGRAPLLMTAAFLVLTLGAVTLAVERAASRGSSRSSSRLGSHDRGSAWLEGARLVRRSRYLLAVVGLVTLYETTSNIIDFQLAAAVQLEVEGSEAKDAFFGLVGQLTGVVSILAQLLVTSWVMRRFGVGMALLVLPVAILGGSMGFLIVPSLALAAVMSTSDNALAYSVNQSAKEALYVPLDRHEKYKAKAFIDMFVQRGAKVLSIALALAASEIVGLEGVRWLSLPVLVTLVGWIWIARWLGQRNAELLGDDAPVNRTEPP
jgi:AAA family ATP:ADP antiporter